jgi:hypothetical protein
LLNHRARDNLRKLPSQGGLSGPARTLTDDPPARDTFWAKSNCQFREKIAVKVNYAQPLGNDMAMAAGDVDVTFNVEPKLRPLFWSAVYVKEGGQWKIRMLTAGIKPPPPPKEAMADKK